LTPKNCSSIVNLRYMKLGKQCSPNSEW